MKTTPYVLGLIILIILAMATGLAFKNKGKMEQVAVSSYEECVKAGYPVMESYPEQCRTPEGKTFVHAIATSTTPTPPPDTTGSTPNVDSMIHVTNPIPNQTISSGFELRGEAKGGWFFEATSGGSIEDANGKVLAQFPVTATRDWMTSDFVPFKQTVTYSMPETTTGRLILANDNPSGLPENSKRLVIPVKFATSSMSQISVKAFFSNSTLAGGDNADCSKVFAVARSIPKTSTTGKAAIEELLKGPLSGEAGYMTNINSGTKLNSLIITNGVARADFNAILDSGVAGSCKVSAIRAQIEQTLKQFASVKQVIISVNGNSDSILQP